MRCRVFLIEDSTPMREAVSRVVSEECDVVGYAADGRDALEATRAIQPDVVLLDISLPNINGMALLPVLREALPEVTIIMLSNHDHAEYIAEAYRRGADAYVCKNEAHQNLLPAIRRGRTKAVPHGISVQADSQTTQDLVRG